MKKATRVSRFLFLALASSPFGLAVDFGLAGVFFFTLRWRERRYSIQGGFTMAAVENTIRFAAFSDQVFYCVSLDWAIQPNVDTAFSGKLYVNTQ